MASIRPARPGGRHKRPSWASLSPAILFIRSRPAILGAISLDLFAVLLGGATALLPIYARDILLVGPWGLGLLRSMPAAGAVLHGAVSRPPAAASATPAGACCRRWRCSASPPSCFGLSTSLSLSLACLFVLGAADMISVYVRQTLVQLDTPDAMRGRVAAVNAVFIGASNELGEFESGLLAATRRCRRGRGAGRRGHARRRGPVDLAFPALRDRDRLVEPRG